MVPARDLAAGFLLRVAAAREGFFDAGREPFFGRCLVATVMRTLPASHDSPGAPGDDQPSLTTGTIIGRRRVRSFTVRPAARRARWAKP